MNRPWTLPRAPDAAVTAPAQALGRARNAKTLVVVPVAGGVPVARARPEVLGIVVPGAAANHTTAGGRSGPRDRLPARCEPPVPEDRAAQPPRVGVRRVRHPGARTRCSTSPRVTVPARQRSRRPRRRLRKRRTFASGSRRRPSGRSSNPRNVAGADVVATCVFAGCSDTRRRARNAARRPRHASSRAGSSANSAKSST